MSGATYVRFYASDWRSGCIGLTLEQEGFYIRVCAYIYETGLRLSIDDKKAAKFLGVHTNAYRTYRDQLAALGKLVKFDDGWTVIRAEKELKAASMGAARRSDGAQPMDRGTSVETNAGALPHTVADTTPDTQHNTTYNTPHNTTPDFFENGSEIKTPLKSQELVVIKEKEEHCAVVTAPCSGSLPDNPRARGRAPRQRGSRDVLDVQFEQWWQIFPAGRKRGKGKCRTLFITIASNAHYLYDATAEKLIDAARRYAETRPDPQYVPMPYTWLSQGRWEDDVYDAPKAISSSLLDAIVNGGWG